MYYNHDYGANMCKHIYDLTAGTYYFQMHRISARPEYTGKYTFKLSFTDAKESFKEAFEGSNNTMLTASSIKLNTAYTGQLAKNDENDFYKIKISKASDISFAANSKMKEYYIRVFDKNGKSVSSSCSYYDNRYGENVYSTTLSLKAGTYYLGVQRYSNNINGDYTGTYNFCVCAVTNAPVSIKKVTNAGSGKVKVTLNKPSSKVKKAIDGIEIRYSLNKKFEYSSSIVTLKKSASSKVISKLYRNNKYYFQVRTYKSYKVGKAKVKAYSPWSKTKSIKTRR